MRLFKNIFGKPKKDKRTSNGSKELEIDKAKTTSDSAKSRLQFIHNGLKEFYPFSFDELKQNLKLEFDLDDTLTSMILI